MGDEEREEGQVASPLLEGPAGLPRWWRWAAGSLIFFGVFFFCVGLFVPQYIDHTLHARINEGVVVQDKDDPGYEGWLTNTEEDDVPEYRVFHMMNLTNPTAFAQGQGPKYKDVGPYVFRVFKEKFDVEFQGSSVTYSEWSRYLFQEEESKPHTLDDPIYSANPAYLAGTRLSGGEKNILFLSLGPTLAKLVNVVTEGTHGASREKTLRRLIKQQADVGVVDPVENIFLGTQLTKEAEELARVLRPELVRTNIARDKTIMVHRLEGYLNATASIEAVQEVIQTIVGDARAKHDKITSDAAINPSTSFNEEEEQVIAYRHFFNDDKDFDTVKGLFRYHGKSFGFSLDAVRRVLHGSSGSDNETFPGWLQDTKEGAGLYAFAEVYRRFEAGAIGHLHKHYDMSVEQLEALGKYVVNYLFAKVAPARLGGPTTVLAEDAFYTQWANASMIPEGLDFDLDGTKEHFEAGLGEPTGLWMDQAKKLFDPAFSLSFTNEEGLARWTANVTQDFVAQCKQELGLSPHQVARLHRWVLHITVQSTEEFVHKAFNVPRPPDLPPLPSVNLGTVCDDSDEEEALKEVEKENNGPGGRVANCSVVVYGGPTDSLNPGIPLMPTTPKVNETTPEKRKACGDIKDAALCHSTVVDDEPCVWAASNITTGCFTKTDAGFLQWGALASINGVSLHKLGGTNSPGPPEFAAWARDINKTPYTFSLVRTREILTGPVGLVHGENALHLLTLFQQSAKFEDQLMVNITRRFGFSETEAGLLAGYLQYVVNTFTNKEVGNLFLHNNGGMVSQRSVLGWLYEYPQEPFLKTFYPDDSSKWSNHLFSNYTREEAEKRILPSAFNTGRDDIHLIHEMSMWKKKKTIDKGPLGEGIWLEPIPVKGRLGSQFPPGVKRTDKLYVWNSDLLRTLCFVFEKEVKEKGIKLLRFALEENVLASEEENPFNRVFRQHYRGLANLSYALEPPLFISMPHFLDGDPALRANTSGLHPNTEKHSTFLDVEPTTGAVMNYRKRLQVNFRVGPTDTFYKERSEAYVPVLWLEDSGTITDKKASSFKDKVYGAEDLMNAFLVGGCVSGVCLLMLGIGLTIYIVKRDETQPYDEWLLDGERDKEGEGTVEGEDE